MLTGSIQYGLLQKGWFTRCGVVEAGKEARDLNVFVKGRVLVFHLRAPRLCQVGFRVPFPALPGISSIRKVHLPP